MGRRLGFVLVFVGLFLLFFGLFERVYAYPRLKKAPLDQYSEPVATGTGTYFNLGRLAEVDGAQLKNLRVVRGDVRAGTEEVAVWDSFNSTVDTADQGVITATQERIALDRVTGQSVQCCGENPRHQGLTLKFPFDTRKTTYQFWDGPAQRALPATFTREERINGVRVYRFEQRIDRLDVGDRDLPGSLAGDPEAATVPTDVIYSNVKTLWVEPATGIIVKAQQDVTQVLETPAGGPVLTLLGTVLPVAALLLALVCLAAGLVLLRSPEGRRVARPEGESRPAGAV